MLISPAVDTRPQTLAAIYTVVFSALHFSILCSREKISFRQALSRSPASAVSFALGVILVFPVMALLGYHLRVRGPVRLRAGMS